jgi:GNAT superfamily N-acetyltransferase
MMVDELSIAPPRQLQLLSVFVKTTSMAVGGDWVLREASPDTDGDAVAALMVEYLTWAHGRLREEYGVDDPPADPALVRSTVQDYRRPEAMILLAQRAGNAIGVGALRRHGDEIAEVKRMYVVPVARSLHIGSALLDRLIEEARAMNARVLRLDTCRFMTDAQRLYESRGFVERPPYEGTEIPPRLQQYWKFYERQERDH